MGEAEIILFFSLKQDALPDSGALPSVWDNVNRKKSKR
jgi:hypothetical protein